MHLLALLLNPRAAWLMPVLELIQQSTHVVQVVQAVLPYAQVFLWTFTFQRNKPKALQKFGELKARYNQVLSFPETQTSEVNAECCQELVLQAPAFLCLPVLWITAGVWCSQKARKQVKLPKSSKLLTSSSCPVFIILLGGWNKEVSWMHLSFKSSTNS